MAKYNGHKNWNHWNVSLWIHNEEWMYRLAKQCIKDCQATSNHSVLTRASYLLLNTLKEDYDLEQTPDGAPFSYTTIRAAMREM